MNHEIICKYCDKDQRLYGLDCCSENINKTDKRIEKELEKCKILIKILKKYNISAYLNDYGGLSFPKTQIEKLIKLLGG